MLPETLTCQAPFKEPSKYPGTHSLITVQPSRTHRPVQPTANVTHCVSVCTPGGNYKETRRTEEHKTGSSASIRFRLYGTHQNPKRKKRRYNTLRFTNQWSSKCLAYRGHRARQGGSSDCQQGPRASKCTALFPVSITNTEKRNLFFLFKTVMLILFLKDEWPVILLQTTAPALSEDKTKHEVRNVPRRRCIRVKRPIQETAMCTAGMKVGSRQWGQAGRWSEYLGQGQHQRKL